MASQVLIFSSFSPKLATFNSRSTPSPQLALLKSPRALNYCSSSLPTLSLQLKSFNLKSDFKCQAAADPQKDAPSQGKPIQVGEYVTSLGEFAVRKANEYGRQDVPQITFENVESAMKKSSTYTLRIVGNLGQEDLVETYEAVVSDAGPFYPWKLTSFDVSEYSE